jgi:hypothetical protein|tara:strand:- start:1028 stop:1201 length:174 start_codon:yes stop_codon:yes gene_type:complete
MPILVYDFASIRKDVRQKQGRWTMEDDIRMDMLEAGYNPASRLDIEEYWQEIFGENE